MTERPVGRGPRGEDDFERRLLDLIDAKEVYFPKGLTAPLEDLGPRQGSLGALLDQIRHGLAGVMLHPAFAYAVVLALSVPAYRGLTAHRVAPARAPAATPGLAPAAPRVSSPVFVELDSGPVRGGGAGSTLDLARSDGMVALSFLAPIRRGSGATYQATLTDAAGHVVAVKTPLRSTDEVGHFVLVCGADLFAPGDYLLTVTGTPGAGAPQEEFRFPFHVIRSSSSASGGPS
jgi:hypothetical protein